MSRKKKSRHDVVASSNSRNREDNAVGGNDNNDDDDDKQPNLLQRKVKITAGNDKLFNEVLHIIISPTFFTTIAWLIGATTKRPSFFVRLLMYIILEATYCMFFYTILLYPSRWLSRRLPGAFVPNNWKSCEIQESEQNDKSLIWPSTTVIDKLPIEWQNIVTATGNNEKQQPYFLNHVRGSTRLRQATYRLSAALGTILSIIIMTKLVDHQYYETLSMSFNMIGLESPVSYVDLLRGYIVGTVIIIILFMVEIQFKWIKIIGFFETVVPNESLILNLIWDVLFHIGVSINEEISMRGWILINTALYVQQQQQQDNNSSSSDVGNISSPIRSIVISVLLQSLLFGFMHVGSPGASIVGLVNLIVGGIISAANVFISGNLYFSLGWHFGWNLTMGHLLGLSTSGIPMSAKLVSIVPHPSKSHLHGGKFGPEQSPIAPIIYILGFIPLLYLYGTTDGIANWINKLQQKQQ